MLIEFFISFLLQYFSSNVQTNIIQHFCNIISKFVQFRNINITQLIFLNIKFQDISTPHLPPIFAPFLLPDSIPAFSVIRPVWPPVERNLGVSATAPLSFEHFVNNQLFNKTTLDFPPSKIHISEITF